jgi:hypothetical protein
MLEHFLEWAFSLIQYATVCVSNNNNSGDNVMGGNYEVQLAETSPHADVTLHCGVKALWHILGFCEKLISQTKLMREMLCFQEVRDALF